MPRRMLPIGIQTFRDLRERGCYYVDKTPYLERLVAEGKHYFLSRPRRFGACLTMRGPRRVPASTERQCATCHNGYRWLGDEGVYNPCDILLLFRRRKFNAYWFETATPSFLVETLLDRGVATPHLDGVTGTETLLGIAGFEVEAG